VRCVSEVAMPMLLSNYLQIAGCPNPGPYYICREPMLQTCINEMMMKIRKMLEVFVSRCREVIAEEGSHALVKRGCGKTDKVMLDFGIITRRIQL